MWSGVVDLLVCPAVSVVVPVEAFSVWVGGFRLGWAVGGGR